IFAAARIFTASKLNFEATIRLVCYALGPAVFAVLPGMGNILLLVWIPILLIIGAKEVYQTTSGRSILIALFPSLVLFGIIILAMLVFALGFFKIIFSFLQ
ncbi:MAG: YIP1 family protein, partial [Deltaproteobacteria bacterium]|nr:YIP1 family protein [Deltaproteobacteria bacterium]